MSKKICKICKKELTKKDLEEFLETIKDAEFFCKKCGRVAKEKSKLCKSEKIPQ